MEEKTFEQRKTEFLAKYKSLIDEYQVDWLSFPMFRPNNEGIWEVVIQTKLADTKGQGIISPFVPQ